MTKEKVLLLGSTGLIGSELLPRAQEFFDEVIAPTRAQIDYFDLAALSRLIKEVKPTQVFDADGYTDVNGAEKEPDKAHHLNVLLPETAAEVCHDLGIRYGMLSSDYVFNGSLSARPYHEGDEPDPLSEYGLSKFRGEETVMNATDNFWIGRTSMPFSEKPHKKRNFALKIVDAIESGEVWGVTNQDITPIYIPSLVEAAIAIMRNPEVRGIYHIAPIDSVVPIDLVKKMIFYLSAYKPVEIIIRSVTFQELYGEGATRPQYPWLDPSKFIKDFGTGVLMSMDEQLEKFCQGVVKDQ